MEIIVAQPIDIKSLILNIRGVQVLLDSDVAMLYGYETKQINRTASRNKERFPESFYFQLAKEEAEMILSLRCQNGTLKRGQHRKYQPYVYTEQGIAMLSGLLKNEIAVQVSIGIMQAFVEMRCFISVHRNTFERLTNVEYKLLEHDERFDELFDQIQVSQEFRQGIFFKGQIYDSFKLIMDIIKSAYKTIVIIDNYADRSVLEMLKDKKEGVIATIICNAQNKISNLAISKFNDQYPDLHVLQSDEFHDRFIIIDDEKLYHIGASLKDAGKKCFAISLIEDKSYLELMKENVTNTKT